MKKALPAETLGKTWDSLVTSMGEPGRWSIVQRVVKDGSDVRGLRVAFERGALDALVTVAPTTQEVSGLFFKPAAKEAAARASAPYVKAAAFHTENVSVGSEPFLLSGTLLVPNGAGPFPAAVLVHGSGPHDRDETIGASKPFKDIAEGLASRGVAVLRYDKRTFQHGQKLTNAISLDDEVVNDAIAAAVVLGLRRDVGRVFVVGHSLGALLAPEIAMRSIAQKVPVAGVALLAPPGRPPLDSVLMQLRYLDAPAKDIAEVERQIALFKSGKLGTGTILGAPATYWQDWSTRDGVGMARKLHVPVLVLRGERDYQVTDDDIATWRKGLAGTPRVDIATVASCNHLFIEGTGKPGPAEYETPGYVQEGVIVRLAKFLGGAP